MPRIRIRQMMVIGIALLAVIGLAQIALARSMPTGSAFTAWQATPPPGTPPPRPEQHPLPEGTNPLVAHRIHLATSDDGLHWDYDSDDILREATSVPALAYWQDALWIIAVTPPDPEATVESLVSMHQMPDGTWEEAAVDLAFEGRAVDPDLMVLPDGSLRVYFFDFSVMSPPPPPGQSNGPGMIYSAVSEDGVHFVLEEGERLALEPPGTDPSVVQTADDLWWMYISTREGMVAANSADGLTFEEAGLVTYGSIASTVRLDDGTLRQYACSVQRGMVIAESTDGLTWEEVEDIDTPRGCDPSVVQLPDGTWAMVYKTLDPTITPLHPPQQQPGTPPPPTTGG